MAELAVGKEESQDVFDALYEHWKKVKNPATKQAISRILLAANQRQAEINHIRSQRFVMRLQLEQKANINGNLVTGELHELEYDACRFLCPAIRGGNGTAVREGWRWIMKQPWGKDFRAAPFEKRYHH